MGNAKGWANHIIRRVCGPQHRRGWGLQRNDHIAQGLAEIALGVNRIGQHAAAGAKSPGGYDFWHGGWRAMQRYLLGKLRKAVSKHG